MLSLTFGHIIQMANWFGVLIVGLVVCGVKYRSAQELIVAVIPKQLHEKPVNFYHIAKTMQANRPLGLLY